uniref:Large ribosomal subunit protein uL15m n=1 Tax=Lygus hesperus TaxID=30085 RepID=A0A0A9YKY2_LYGHE
MLWRRTPKFGFPRRIPKQRLTPVTLQRILQYIQLGKLSTEITMLDLLSCRITHGVKYGIKVVGSAAPITAPIPAIHMQVTHTSDSVRRIIEDHGGSVNFVYFNRLNIDRMKGSALRDRSSDPWKEHLVYPCIRTKFANQSPKVARQTTPPPRLRLRYELQSSGKSGWSNQREVLAIMYVRKSRKSHKRL